MHAWTEYVSPWALTTKPQGGAPCFRFESAQAGKDERLFGIAYLRCGATSSCTAKASKLLQKNNKRFFPPFYSTALIRLAGTSLSCGAIGQHVGARVASEVSECLRWCRCPQGESNPPAVHLNTYFHG